MQLCSSTLLATAVPGAVTLLRRGLCLAVSLVSVAIAAGACDAVHDGCQHGLAAGLCCGLLVACKPRQGRDCTLLLPICLTRREAVIAFDNAYCLIQRQPSPVMQFMIQCMTDVSMGCLLDSPAACWLPASKQQWMDPFSALYGRRGRSGSVLQSRIYVSIDLLLDSAAASWLPASK